MSSRSCGFAAATRLRGVGGGVRDGVSEEVGFLLPPECSFVAEESANGIADFLWVGCGTSDFEAFEEFDVAFLLTGHDMMN